MSSFFTRLALLSLLTACSRAQSAAPANGLEVGEVRFQTNPGQITLPELAQELGYFAPLKLKSVGDTFSGPADIQTVATGDSDLGVAFNGAVIKLVAAGAPIRAVVGGYGMDERSYGGFYVLEGSPIRGARDLIGKKVAMNTLGAHSEFVLREYLQRNGVSDSEARQVEMIVLPPVSTEQALRAGQVEAVYLSHIMRDKLVERGGVRLLSSDTQLYGVMTAGSYVMHERFLRDNPNAARKVVEGIAKAIEWSRDRPREEVIALQEKIAKRREGSKIVETVRYWQSFGIAGKGGVISERELTIWLAWLEQTNALKKGEVKLARVYTNALNPFAER